MASPRRELLAFVLLQLAACGGSRAAPSAPEASPGVLRLRFQTAHVRLYPDSAPDAVLHSVADRLEAELPRFQADLAVAAAGPVEVRVWQDEAAWNAEILRYMGRPVQAQGYVTGRDGIRVQAVSQVARNACHELVHCVSLYANPRIGNNPRWLWETIALYENGERVDLRTLPYMVSGQPPSLAELDSVVMNSRRVYEVGYSIGEFIVARHGPTALVGLLRTNGDTQSVLGLSTAEFEAAWYAFARERYGL